MGGAGVVLRPLALRLPTPRPRRLPPALPRDPLRLPRVDRLQAGDMTPDHVGISVFLQNQLSRRSLDEVPAVEAAQWLDKVNLLQDSRSRPGLPLRNLLRAGKVFGAE